jgi:hypothetical protein
MEAVTHEYDYDCRDASRGPSDNLYPQKLALNSPASSDRSFGIVRSLTEAMEFFFSSH